MTEKQNLRANNIHLVTVAALDLFFKNGIDNSTVDDIAEHAGISKMSIFRYFDTKVNIVAAATEELFENVDICFKNSHFFDSSGTLTGMELVKKYLDIYPHLIDQHPQFLNYLCEVVLFFSKHDISYQFPRFNLMEESWIRALETGMSDNSVAHIEHYETSHRTIHNLFMGVNLRLFLKAKDLSSPDITNELKGQTQRILDMTIKYLAP